MITETKFTVGEYKTRDGRRARVYATDGVKPFYIHGASLSDRGWLARTWTANGHWSADENPSPSDLMPPLREWWGIDGSAIHYNTREEAEERVKDLLADGVPGPLTITKYREVRDDQA